MAVVLAFRVAIVLAPSTYRLVRWAEGPGVAQLERLPRPLLDRLHDPGESDAALSDAVAEWSGTLAEVTTFNEPFELRKWQLTFTRASGALVPDDVAVITFHAINAPGGVPTATWAAQDFIDVANALSGFWDAVDGWFPDEVVLDSIKAYKAGPDVSPPQPPVYSLDVNLPGTSSAVPLPPQVAVTVTERAGTKPHWGRFYLPSPALAGPASASTLKTHGRISDAFSTALADAADTAYEACRTSGKPLVVYRSPLPVRHTAAQRRAILAGEIDESTPGDLPARDGSAWTVDTIAIDDVYDVIRSRRWDVPLLRTLRGVGA